MRMSIGISSVVLLAVIVISMFSAPSAFAVTSSGTWSKTYGGPNWDVAYALAQTSDGGYALAGFTESFGAGAIDFWLIKTDVNGNMLWNKTYGGKSYDDLYSMVQTTDGGYALAGLTQSFGDGLDDFWLIKTDSGGNMLWNKTYGGGGAGVWFSMVQTRDGGYAIANTLLIKTDASGNMQWNKTYGSGYSEAYSLIQTEDGGYALAGQTTYQGAVLTANFWLVKTDVNGNTLWNKNYGGTGDEDTARSVVQTGDGGYALVGYTSSFGAGGDDFWLVKTDASGNMLWNRTYGGPYADEAYSVVQTSDGGYALAGDTWSPGSGTQFWLVKTDSSGSMLWSNTYGTGTAYSMVRTSDGGYALAGETSSGAGEGDFMLVKTDANGGVSHFPLLLILGVSVAVFVIVISLTVIRAKRKGRARAVEHESVSAREG